MSSLERLNQLCADAFAKGRANEVTAQKLRTWMNERELQNAALVEQFMEADPLDWQQMILSHPAGHHPWYPYLRDFASTYEFSSFLVEEAEMPAFIPLLERVREQMSVPEQIAAVTENIDDEYHPVPHFVLFKQMLEAAQERAPVPGVLDDRLVETNLVFYSGYFLDNAYAIGALFATETMLHVRAGCMLAGLKRLGFSDYEAQFMVIHAVADEHHAADWLARVIIPEIEKDPARKLRCASGIAVRLATSKAYLDRLYLPSARRAEFRNPAHRFYRLQEARTS